MTYTASLVVCSEHFGSVPNVCRKLSEIIQILKNMPTFEKILEIHTFQNPKPIRNSSETRPKLGLVRNSKSEYFFCFTTVFDTFRNSVESETNPKLSETLGALVFFQKYYFFSNFIRNSPKLSETLRRGGGGDGKASGWGGSNHYGGVWCGRWATGEADGGLTN